MTAKRNSAGLMVCALALAAAIGFAPAAASAAATIVIVNNNAAGVGFNDPTPVAPIGGNTGTTLGEQRLIAFQAAADIWGATLTSSVPISILSDFVPLTCTATSAILGSAGPTEVWSFNPTSGVPLPNYWYHFALANKLAGVNLDPTTAQIRARFNVNLGNTGCFTGTGWYLGLDNNHGTQVDLITVLLHEFSHGLGFSTVTNGTSGEYLAGMPSVFDHFMKDTTTGKWWDQMTDAERASSALNSRRVVWTGANVSAGVPLVLAPGTPLLTVSAPASVANTYAVGTAAFGPALASPGLTGEVMPVVSQLGSTGPGCEAFNSINQLAVNGKIALIDRGVCAFIVKVKNAQNAGAIGVLIANNAAGSPPAGLGGADPTITIPAVMISLADANTLKDALKYRSRLHSGMFATMGLNPAIRAGADALGNALLFTPNPYQGGSSVSHWDTIAFPNLLMEPNINSDLSHHVVAPWDLTFPLLRDIGW
jgi:hypothetical protein